MGFTAIICEFNPLHNGHKAILEYAKANYDDPILCLMSGNFVERGEPAIINKYERAITAIKEGADIVLELPVFFSLSYAECFSLGSISILDKLDVKRIIFGSECGDISKLEQLADISLNESEELKKQISFYLAKGYLFANAKYKAISDIYGEETANILNTPNNILGIEYIKAIKKLNSKIIPITIKRYNDKTRFISSSKIRDEMLFDERFMPRSSVNYKDCIYDNTEIKNRSFSLLQYKLSNTDKSDIEKISEVTEGLENKILNELAKASSFDELCEKIKSKRYTMAKIKRILISSLLDIDKTVSKNAIDDLSYVYALAVKRGCEKYLKGTSEMEIIKSEREMFSKNSFSLYTKKADALYSIITNRPLKNEYNSVRIVD